MSVSSIPVVEYNDLKQPVGAGLPDWRVPAVPAREILSGTFCRLEPADPALHAESLYAANSLDTEGRMWTYLPYGPFDDFNDYQRWLGKGSAGDDPIFYAIVDQKTGQASGLAGYLRISPEKGSIEVGHLSFSPLLQRTAAATEAMFLMMRRAFELGYRRYEWKCNAHNRPSRAAAQRLGFSFEGVFRQDNVIKGRNRDTAWFSVIDQEWPALEAAFSAWLSPANFDQEGKQKQRLSAWTGPVLKARDPDLA